MSVRAHAELFYTCETIIHWDRLSSTESRNEVKEAKVERYELLILSSQQRFNFFCDCVLICCWSCANAYQKKEQPNCTQPHITAQQIFAALDGPFSVHVNFSYQLPNAKQKTKEPSDEIQLIRSFMRYIPTAAAATTTQTHSSSSNWQCISLSPLLRTRVTTIF